MAENTEMKEKPSTSGDIIKPNFSEVGKSGTLVSSSQIESEYLSELKGVKGQSEYNKMLQSDSKLRQVYHAVNNPIRSAKWDIDPASTDELDLKVAALIKHILFNDIPGGWKAKLTEIMTFPWKGHAVFEKVHINKTHKSFGPYTGLKNIAFRAQNTLTEWEFKDGVLTRIRQEQQGDLEVDAWLDVANLIIFYNEKIGDDNGYPFLRMLYGNYKRKLLYKQLQAIGIERAALPVPSLELPKDLDPDSEDYKLAESQLQAFTLAENAYFMIPHGYKLNFNQTNSFDPSRVQVAIKAENEEIAGALVAMFLEMGIGGNSGNQAGTEVSAKFFRDGIEYLADMVCDVINLQLIPELVRLNFGDTVEVMPKLIYSGISEESGKALMEIVTGYVKEGVITQDEQLEDYIRKQHNLPKKAQGEMVDNQKGKNDPNSPDDKNKKPAAAPIEDENEDDEPEVKLNEKKFLPAHRTGVIDFAAKPSEVQALMSGQAKKASEAIKNALAFSGNKFIADTMNRFKQLKDSKKQNATSGVKVGGSAKFRDALKSVLAETAALAIDQARKEVPTKTDVELSSKDMDLERMRLAYGDIEDVRLSDYSKLPAHIQVLIQKQAELISEQSLNDLVSKLSFTYSSVELKSTSPEIIKQNLEETLDDYINSPQVAVKGENVAAIVVNEGRGSFFFDDDVLDEIHSFTFMNRDPKSPICRELAGTTFNTNDAESLRYHPPLHHNCKSYLRANLKSSKGVEKLEVKPLAPSATAIKSITL